MFYLMMTICTACDNDLKGKHIEWMVFRTIVVAVDEMTGGIGNNGGLLYSIPKDLKHFANITTRTGATHKRNAVVMGRKTWDSIPQVKKPLKNRINIVFTSNKIDHSDVYSVTSMAEYKQIENELAGQLSEIFIIGGQQIYKLFFECNLIDECVCTHIKSNHAVVFDAIFDLRYLQKFRCEKVIEHWSENANVSCTVVCYSNYDHSS